METSDGCSSLGPNPSFISKSLLTKYVSSCSPGDPPKIKSIFLFFFGVVGEGGYFTKDLHKNICLREGDAMGAIFNEACTFRLFFVLEALLKCPSSLTFTLICELISEWLGQEQP